MLQRNLLESKSGAIRSSVLPFTEPTEQTAKFIRPILFRAKHTVTTDAHTALTRLVQRLKCNTDNMDTEFNGQAQEYYSLISQFEQFEEVVHTDFLEIILSELFLVYHPGGM